MAKIGRNAPCPCGSGKKFKQCCGREPAAATPEGPVIVETTSRGMPDRRVMERTMADVTRFLAEHDFASLEEVNAFLQQALSGGQAPHPEGVPQSFALLDCLALWLAEEELAPGMVLGRAALNDARRCFGLLL